MKKEIKQYKSLTEFKESNPKSFFHQPQFILFLLIGLVFVIFIVFGVVIIGGRSFENWNLKLDNNLVILPSPMKVGIIDPKVYTPKQARDNKKALIGKRITVQGEVEYVPSICTEGAYKDCLEPPKGVCCNTCHSNILFGIDGTQIFKNHPDYPPRDIFHNLRLGHPGLEREKFLSIFGSGGGPLGGGWGSYDDRLVECTGDDCGNVKDCYPLEHGPTYQVTGVLGYDAFEGAQNPILYLIMEEFKLVE